MIDGRKAATILVALPASAASVRAQDIEPRAYSNIPLGVNFLVAGYGWSEGGLATDPSLPLEDADIRTQTLVVAYARPIEVRGQSGKIDLVLPFAAPSGDRRVFRHAERAGNRRPCGPAAQAFRQPARRAREVGQGARFVPAGHERGCERDRVRAGQYDGSRLINIGTNRWSVRSEVGISKSLDRWTLELAPAITFFADNDDFYGGQTREQDPVHSLQGGVIHSFRTGVWAALNGTYYAGGRTTVDGERKQDRQENTLVGLTLALPIDRRNSIKVYASTGVATRIGTDADTIGLAWQYRWGGGL